MRGATGAMGTVGLNSFPVLTNSVLLGFTGKLLAVMGSLGAFTDGRDLVILGMVAVTSTSAPLLRSSSPLSMDKLLK